MSPLFGARKEKAEGTREATEIYERSICMIRMMIVGDEHNPDWMLLST